MTLPPETVSELIRAGRHVSAVEVRGRLDLTEFRGETLPRGLHCYELDASGSNLTCLPEDIQIDGRPSATLKNLNLHYNYITNEVIQELKKLPLKVDASKPSNMDEDEDEDGTSWRFVAVGE